MTFFESWSSLGRTALSGLLAYVALIVFLRISGKRTLSKLNAFDFVVTVALGSTLASVLTSSRLPLADGLLALASLVILQYVVAWLTVRSAGFRTLTQNRPTVLFRDGAFRDGAMRRMRVGRDDVLAAMRGAGVTDPTEVHAVVLEVDGSLSVLRASTAPDGPSTLDRIPDDPRAE